MIKDIIMYRRNKNIVVENIDNSIMIKIFNVILQFYNSLFSKESSIVFSERIIEYPILFQNINPKVKRILDFGCVEDLLPIHLASLGYIVTGIDFRPYPFKHKNFNFINQDILTWDPPVEEFDTVISISTVEHVGLSSYGDPEQINGDKIAIEKLLCSLKKGGDLIITLPAGKPCIKRGMRIYDRVNIENLVPKIKLLKFYYKPTRYGEWIETTEDIIASLTYANYFKASPAQGVAFIIAVKE